MHARIANISLSLLTRGCVCLQKTIVDLKGLSRLGCTKRQRIVNTKFQRCLSEQSRSIQHLFLALIWLIFLKRRLYLEIYSSFILVDNLLTKIRQPPNIFCNLKGYHPWWILWTFPRIVYNQDLVVHNFSVPITMLTTIQL